MSIIFEALRKIEEEKREDPLGGLPPVAPGLHGDRPTRERRRISWAQINTAVTVGGIPLIFLAVIYLQHRIPGNAAAPAAPTVARRAVSATSAKPAMAEVRLKPVSIVPALEGFPREANAPAAPAAAPVAQLPSLRLRGLSRSGSRSWAFINDRMLKVGDAIEGAEVVEILGDRVKLRSGGTVFTLTY